MIDVVGVRPGMYEIHCSSCGEIGFHPSRIGAESRGERHAEETDHTCTVRVMDH